MAKHGVSHASSEPVAHEKNESAKTEAPTPAPVVKTTAGKASFSVHDAEVLHACLSRVARLHGYADEHMPEAVADIDTAGCDPRIAGLVAWAKTARMP